MSKEEFSRNYYTLGTEAAIEVALFFGVTKAQVDLWLLSVYKPAYWQRSEK